MRLSLNRSLREPAFAVACSLLAGQTLSQTNPTSRLRLQTEASTMTLDEASSWGQRIESLARRGALRLLRTQEDRDFPGSRHLRYAQHINDVPVFGAQIVQHVDAHGRTLSVCGRLAADDIGETRPSLTPEQAIRIVEQAGGPDAWSVTEPELSLLPLSERPVLVYALWSRSSRPYSLMRYFVDARFGDIVLRYQDLRTGSVVGVGTGVWFDHKKVSANREGARYIAEDRLRPALIQTYDMRFDQWAFERGLTNGFIASDADNKWSDGAVVDAHVYAGWTYDYYFLRHGRRGVDDADMPIRNFVHFDVEYSNAFWDPLRNTMNYGDGGYLFGVYFRAFSSALDVVAHELSHGVTDYTWAGIYWDEPGALTETFSDVMSTAVEFYHESAGNGRNRADYWAGEDLSDVFDPSKYAIRSIADPLVFGDPDHYSIRYQGDVDNRGVHINCGIGNNAYYLLVEGGRNRTSGKSVTGLGSANRGKAERIFYRGFTRYLFPSATFADARRATIRAAQDLYGAGSAEARETASAWSAVGVE